MINHNDFKLAADFLLTSKDSSGLNLECIYRCSSGRYYYELFHIVKEWLQISFPQEYKASGGGTDEALQVCCSLIFDKLEDNQFEKLERKLRNLHSLRVKADYYLTQTFSKGDLITMQSETERTISLINVLTEKYSPTKTA